MLILSLLSCIIFVYVFTGDTPCPVYENDTIIQQPVDLLELSETYSIAATNFINEMAGMLS